MQQPIKTERSGCLMLFGLPFFLAGVGAFFWIVFPIVSDGWPMQSWPSTSAQLLSAKLSVNRSSDSTTYNVNARYRYTVNGRSYTNDRPAILTSGDNVGDFQEKLGRRLERARTNNRSVPVYYNPDDPADSVLNRDIRWSMVGFGSIFLVLFGGIGGGIIYWGWRGKRTVDTPEVNDKPWLANTDWHDNSIFSDAKGGMYATWGFAVFWNLISFPVAIFGFEEIWKDEGWLALLVLLFPLIGLVLIYFAIKSTMEWKRFGRSPLTMDPFPGSIGGHVGGSIALNMPYKSRLVYKVTLSCVHSYVSGSGKNRSRRESAKWQDEGYAHLQPAANGSKLEFRFDVPEGLPVSEEHSNNYHLWRLHLLAEMEGADLDRNFEIPVYDTAEQARHIRIDSVKDLPGGVQPTTIDQLLPITRQGDTVILNYPMFRKLGRSIGIILFGSVFFGTAFFLWGEAQKEGFMLYMMSSVFGLVGGAILLWGLYDLLNGLWVKLDGQTIKVARSLLGIRFSSKQAAYFEIQSVEAKEGMKSNSGKKHTIEYHVIARTNQGELRLAEHLTSSSDKDRVIEFFQKEFKLEESSFEL